MTSHHVLKRKNKDLNNKLDTILKKTAIRKSNMACESDSNSEFSESMEQSATSNLNKSAASINCLKVDSGTSATLVTL